MTLIEQAIQAEQEYKIRMKEAHQITGNILSQVCVSIMEIKKFSILLRKMK